MKILRTIQSDDLERPDEIRFQLKLWRAEWFFYALMAALVAGALAGFFGKGPLSTESVRSADGSFAVEYERLGRLHTAEELRVSGVSRDGQAVVFLDHALLDAAEIESVQPEPVSTQSVAGGVEYVFASTPGQTARITFFLKPSKGGFRKGLVGVGESPERISIRRFVYL